MAALIGALRVSLSADTAAFQSGMKRAETQAKTSASSIQKSLGLVKAGFAGFISGFSIATITQAIKASLDYAGSLGEVAQQLGVTARELQVFRFAVQQNGGTAEDADKALGKLSLSISRAQSGSKQAVAAFDAVNVKLADLKNLSKEEILGKIADEMKRTGGASANAAAGVAIFGKGFQKIIPVLDQGALGLKAAADEAERFGLILSEEEIQNADITADKIDKLMTAFKVKIAAEVSENADAIGDLISTIAELVGWLERARAALVNFQQNFNLPNLLFKGDAFGLGVAGRTATADVSEGGTALALAKKMGLKIAGAGGGAGSPTPFLGGGGGGGKSKRAPRDTSLRDAFQFEEEQRRADIDILRAKQDLAHDYVDRTALSIQILNLEKEGFEAQLKYEVAAKEKTKAQADAAKLKNDELDHLKRMAVLEQQEEDRQRDYNMLEDRDFDAKMDLLERQADLVETAKERRDIELKIIDLAYEEQRRRLQRIIDESKDWAEIEKARRDLLDSYRNQSADRQGAMQRNRSPIEDYKARYGDITEENEQAVVNGLEDMADALSRVADGWDAVKEAGLDALKTLLQTLLRNQLNQLFASLLPSAGLGAGGLGIPGFALGGDTLGTSRHRIAGFVHGEEGVLNPRGLGALGVPNLNALNRGVPLSALVSNDNGTRVVNQTFTVYANDADSFRRNERQMTRTARRRLGVQ